MAIRVTQSTMYNTMVGHMQSSLSGYMESVEQGASQKKVNRPSDDPAGTYRVLTTRKDMQSTEQYKENVDTAKGWLNLADQVLSNRLTVAVTGLKALAEQASTGTYTPEQRMIMADQARQYFGQILNLSNTEFEGKSIFAGHKYDGNAFEEGLAITSWDSGWQDMLTTGEVPLNGSDEKGQITIDGATKTTVLVQFTNTADTRLAQDSEYVWSNDGGATWSNPANVVTADDGKLVINAGGVLVNFPENADVKVTGGKDEKSEYGANNGTFLYIRPTAVYKGDDNDAPTSISVMGNQALARDQKDNPDTIKATGTFGKNTLIRFDDDVADDGKEFDWAYSTDGGNTWVEAKGVAPTDGSLRLPIPGGYVDINATSIDKGTQVLVHPARADLGYEIMKDTYLPVNSVGKDVFGGYYEGKPALQGNNNLFEVVGQFIGYLEGNNQEGCQKSLAAFTTAEQQVLAEATRIGGMENRLSMASDVLSFQALDQQERLSYIEDIDLTELLTKLTRQQMTYQTVLQSSSMIMQLSLANYI